MPAYWTAVDIVTDIGGVMKARERMAAISRPPLSHRLFSQLLFARGDDSSDTQQLGEEDLANDIPDANLDCAELERRAGGSGEAAQGGWLENDDIEEF